MDGLIPPIDDGLEMTEDRLLANGGVLFISILFFSCCFLSSYLRLMPSLYRHFSLMSPPLQADFASRLHSTLHALGVPLGLMWCIQSCDIWGQPLMNTCEVAELFFSVSIGYFFVDLVIILFFRIEFWPVYAFHHVCAALPYLINTFVPHCSHCHFLLSLMLGVEVSTVFLNIKWLMEHTENSSSVAYSVVFYVTYVSWLVVRVLNPIYVLILMLNDVFPYYYLDRRLLVSYASALLVTAFCLYCFVFIFTPEVFQRLKRKRPAKPAGIPLDGDAPSDRRLLIEEEASSGTRTVSRNRSRSGTLIFA